MVRFAGLVGPTYTTQAVNIDCQRAVNLYLQMDEAHGGTNGEVAAMIGTPGTRLLASVGTGPIRGLFYTSTGKLACVSGSQLYRINSDWTSTLIGTISGTGPVCMADNGTQLIVVGGTYGYILDLTTGIFSTIISDGFPAAGTVCFQDGYFICNNPTTNQFFISALYDGTSWSDVTADFQADNSFPDNLTAVLSCRRLLWLFGSERTKVWFNSGGDSTSGFPFSRFEGANIEYGCTAPGAAVGFSNTVLWMGGGDQGGGVVWMANGFQPQRISNHAVEIAIKASGDYSTARAYAYQHQGHLFYVLNLPNTATSWVYDISTQQWHERAFLNNGVYQRHQGDCYAQAYGVDVVGDYQTGNLYALDDTVRTDNGNPIRWMRRSPHISANMKRMFHRRITLDMQMGVGLDGTQQGMDPQVCLRYSDDFGNTWSTERSKSLGQIGSYKNRVYFDRLGQTRTRVYEISGSDPVQVVLLGAELDIAAGVS